MQEYEKLLEYVNPNNNELLLSVPRIADILNIQYKRNIKIYNALAKMKTLNNESVFLFFKTKDFTNIIVNPRVYNKGLTEVGYDFLDGIFTLVTKIQLKEE